MPTGLDKVPSLIPGVPDLVSRFHSSFNHPDDSRATSDFHSFLHCHFYVFRQNHVSPRTEFYQTKALSKRNSITRTFPTDYSSGQDSGNLLADDADSLALNS